MAVKQENKRCSACGGEATYLQDVELTNRTLLLSSVTLASLYRCAGCGHFDLYERDADREAQERDAELLRQYKAMPDYRCPQCGRVGKNQQCPNCYMPCLPVSPEQKEEGPRPKTPKKRRWFGRDPDKPDWEG